MKYDNERAFTKHLEGASPKHFSPVYSIVGGDSFVQGEACNLLLRFLLPDQSARKFALTVCHGGQVTEQECSLALYSRSLLARPKVVWIQEAEKLKKEQQGVLEKYCAAPVKEQYLLLTASTWPKNSSLYKNVEKAGVVLAFAEQKPWEKEKRIVEWIAAKAASARILISYDLCQKLCSYCGASQAIVAQELDKLFSYTQGKKQITLSDIEAIVSNLSVDSIWQLGEAIFRRDAKAALAAMHSLLSSGQTLLPLLRQIRSQFQTEYQVALLTQQKKEKEEITKLFPYMKGAILERHISQASQYGTKAFVRGLLILDSAERQAKNSSIDEMLLAELLIIQLTDQP